LIALSHVTVAYVDATPLEDVTCAFEASVNIVMGPSGSGKSTLLRVLAGLQKPDEGTVRVDDGDVVPPTWRSSGDRRVALVHQDYRLVEFLTVEENLRLAAELRSIPVSTAQVETALERVGLTGSFAGRAPASLSGGEQQRVAIARALLCDVEVLLADEPTGALDRDNTMRIANVLAEVGAMNDVLVVIATHDPLVGSIPAEHFQLAAGKLTRA
jgi:ABC-type lipoprotein export system ATPase subunit